MAVIINDFEIVPEAPPAPPDPARDLVRPESLRLSPEDVLAINRRQMVRVRRVWAD